ncbi:MAG: hypothetical protein Q7U91_17360 [Sideroxyarcus sp.]|nr:hypothetical protein [Sideroxyarcus sp.]
MRLPTCFKTLFRGLLLGCAMGMAGCVSAPDVPVKKAPPPVFPAPPAEARFVYERTLYSSADVVEEAASEGLRRMLVGGGRTGEGLGKPYGVAAYEGKVYVSDTAQRVVLVFDIPGKRFYRIGDDDPGGLMKPFGLDLDAQGNLYVVDGMARHIQVYSKDGKFLRTLGSAAHLRRPSGVAVDAAGKRVYVVDIGGIQTDEHKVIVFDAVDGKHLFDFGKRGTGDGEFNLPRDIAIGKDGLLYVVDGGNFRIQVFTPEGVYVRRFGAVGLRSGQFSKPKEIAIGEDGNVYVVDIAFGNFQIFNPQGQVLLAVGGRAETDGPARFMLPQGIAVDKDGRVYMADQYFRKVDVFRPAGLDENAGFAVPGARK